MQLMKKREKLNNSALDRIGDSAGSQSRKFSNPGGNGGTGIFSQNSKQDHPVNINTVNKIYSEKKSGSVGANSSIQTEPTGKSSKRQSSNTDKSLPWTSNNPHGTGGSQSLNNSSS